MRTIIWFIAALATITLVAGNLNDPCGNDGNCEKIKEACLDGFCKCSVAWRQGNEQKCVQVIGSPCYGNNDCENLPGATCENSKCHCKAGYIAGAKECVSLGKEDDECTQSSDCINRITPADNNRECRENKCICKPSFHQGADKRCRATKNLNDVCETEDDCFQADSNNNNALECASDVKSCRCKTGYEQNGDKCSGSAAKFVLSASSLLLVAMAILKM